MAVLRKRDLTVTVPDSETASYVAQGWTDLSAAPIPANKPRARATKPRAARPKPPATPDQSAVTGDAS
jgi:hypothetical protein